ncbi:dihydroneopterin triphosphate 2'-epimerase [Pseudoalteromonas luteoviolacea S2607]|uniref:dihydroneopterin aldolase n=1 Tax=Pseudoalteromonas luteoviolacea TaxID=43657 RepID=UPI0007B08BDC|nr:dihydroneopterin aldolase [Pseudoalteromonas luteoviolacea]KZN33102.1 dihydroneopterin triphosphate 2'-epimerase [Pseudoalteromonas luteoviolacea S2607]
MDKVYISQLHVETIIGVYDFEKESKQSLYFDIEMSTDITQAAKTDDINLAVDYAKVSERVIELSTSCQVELLETLLERLADAILAEFSVSDVKIRVSKPAAVAQAQTVGIEILRTKN